ncbi:MULTISPECIES: aspartate/glutamate racemase family protein [Halocynthiibacter]|uniref:Aspartate/glutamate racemase family protein n=1 Tax=Halocynthiibacter halioticoli TaxID=2986804 RepID=A0AAE3IVT9_9RHOB|nr:MULTISPECIES: aspartate/glutamate racemase family protein [Halocynthiibacter]MCV6822939.1 aspartate/glutamate racemase family protein [Halocynthiibacter halioticoli]MCW4055940.1 aspartate/glutamate racemase family protein [Halocynthiibacter sp. SDUM655004]
MHLVYINPNATQAMTDSVVDIVRDEFPDAKFSGLTNTQGPLAIEGQEDGEAALPGVLALVDHAQRLGADAIIISCFDDTGLTEARAASSKPVYGIGQSAYLAAAKKSGYFSVVTSLGVSVPVIEANISTRGFKESCKGVWASGLPVLEIETGAESVIDTLAKSIDQACETDGSETIVLGCAGMSPLLEPLNARCDVELIDGVRASAALAISELENL